MYSNHLRWIEAPLWPSSGRSKTFIHSSCTLICCSVKEDHCAANKIHRFKKHLSNCLGIGIRSQCPLCAVLDRISWSQDLSHVSKDELESIDFPQDCKEKKHRGKGFWGHINTYYKFALHSVGEESEREQINKGGDGEKKPHNKVKSEGFKWFCVVLLNSSVFEWELGCR